MSTSEINGMKNCETEVTQAGRRPEPNHGKKSNAENGE